MEQAFIKWLRERVGQDPRLPLGLSDDAALVNLSSHSLVVTSDLVSEGVDFHLAKVGPERAGRKALAVNLSDLAAMAARPLCAVISIALPRDVEFAAGALGLLGSEIGESAVSGGGPQLQLAQALYEGVLPLAQQFGLGIAGGDTNVHDGPLVISVTALGEVGGRGPLTRSGGRPGDRLLVTGKLGGSALGHHLDFTPRVHEAMLLHQQYELHAGIDISDGLSLDASRLAAASGCGAVIDLPSVPVSEAAREVASQPPAKQNSAWPGRGSALDHALGDGEDFELLLAVPPAEAKRLLADQPLACGLTDIGELVATEGLWQRDANGKVETLAPRGYLHGGSD